jgi:hypothetical protein
MLNIYGGIAIRALVFIASGLLIPVIPAEAADLIPETLSAWNLYVKTTEQRIAAELASNRGFLSLDFQSPAKSAQERQSVIAGEISVRQIEAFDDQGKRIDIPNGKVHHWRGGIFLPHVTLDAVLARVANPGMEDTRQEDVLESKIMESAPGKLKLYLKLQRSKIVTVVYNTEHMIEWQRYGAMRATSRSVATKIAEVENYHSSKEREKPEGHDRGFLWRMNSYWRYEQIEGGVLVECETITLSRSIPYLLEPLIRPITNSIASESMQRTLDSMRNRYLKSGKSSTAKTGVHSSFDRRPKPPGLLSARS